MRVSVVLALLVMVLPACGDTADSTSCPAEGSGVLRSKTLVSLEGADNAALCDYTAGCFGGYNRKISCDERTWANSAPSREQCLNGDHSSMSGDACLSLTVGEYEDCMSQLSCATGLLLSPKCSALLACVMDTALHDLNQMRMPSVSAAWSDR